MDHTVWEILFIWLFKVCFDLSVLWIFLKTAKASKRCTNT